jgi:hypothetical protein
MIRGYFTGPPGRKRPYVEVPVTVAQTGAVRDVAFLIDTGADRGLLSPDDVTALGLDTHVLPRGRSRGVGGTAATAWVSASLRLGSRRFLVTLRVLVGGDRGSSPSQAAVPSLLGRDLLAHFGLYIEERRDLVLLLEPHEADALALP